MTAKIGMKFLMMVLAFFLVLGTAAIVKAVHQPPPGEEYQEPWEPRRPGDPQPEERIDPRDPARPEVNDEEYREPWEPRRQEDPHRQGEPRQEDPHRQGEPMNPADPEQPWNDDEREPHDPAEDPADPREEWDPEEMPDYDEPHEPGPRPEGQPRAPAEPDTQEPDTQ